MTRILVLDAMGVIYPVGDDVRDLLCPFIHEQGGEPADSQIEALYREARLGKLSARTFWQAVGVDPQLQSSYLERFELAPRLPEFFRALLTGFSEVWCLSNDVSEWSRLLRAAFGLEKWFSGFVISGDVGVRKPDAGIYEHLLSQVRVEPEQVTFVDDRIRNLKAARELGIQTVWFAPERANGSTGHRRVSSFAELHRQLSDPKTQA